MDAIVVAGAVAFVSIAAVFAAGKFIVSLLWPSRENNTIIQLEERYRQLREQAEQAARRDEDSRELARLTSAFEAITVEQNRLNTAEMRDAERAAARKRNQDVSAARAAALLAANTRRLQITAAETASQRTDEKQMAVEQTRLAMERRRQLEESAPMAVEQGGQALSRLRGIEAEDRKRLREQKERISREKEKVERRAAEARQREARESEQQTIDLASRIQPIVWPSEQEYLNARAKIQYSPTHFTFAVAGVAGSGKSSLINIFLDLPDTHPDAAPTGAVETTSEIRRYPDRGLEPPRKWTVWYDIPGAGTLNIPGWQYFNQQCLFVFDLIIVLVGDRMTQVDLEILKNCRLFQMPTFIVRSKADQYIRNTLKSNGYDSDDDIPLDRQQHFRSDYINKTRASIASQLQQAGLPEQRVYIVSCSKAFRAEYAAFTAGEEQPKWRGRGNPQFVDEKALINDLMHAAAARRCDINPRPQVETGRREITGPTPHGPPNTVLEVTPKVLCEYCPPHLAQFSSEASLQNHLASGEHSRAGSSGGNSNQRNIGNSNQRNRAGNRGNRGENRGNRTEDVGCPSVVSASPVPKTSNRRRRPPPPPVDLVQWAQAINQTLAGTNPVTFSIDMLQDIDNSLQQTQLLIMSPTKPLATDICTLLGSLGAPINLRCCACIGGTDLANDQRVLAAKQHVVCGTPGRIAHLISCRFLHTKHIKVLVLDVNGKLLGQDFRAEMQKVHAALPEGVTIIRASIAPAPRGAGRRR